MFVNCKTIMKRIGLLLFLSFFFTIKIKANTAQPGIYQVGEGGGFTLYFLNDCQNFKKIQM